MSSVRYFSPDIMDIAKTTLQWIGGTAVAIALLVGVGIYVSMDWTDTGKEDGSKTKLAVELVSHEGTLEDGRPRSVAGVVRNISSRELGRVKVEITFYNGDETEVGNTSTQTSGLEPEGRWQFEVPVTQDSVSRYEIDRVTWQ